MKKEKQVNIKTLGVKVGATILVLWIIALISMCIIFPKWEVRGQFGDMFGSVNALFSGLAFAGVILAIYLQKNELELQRKELQLTRRELEGQKQQLEVQNITLRKQNFENTLFQLLRFHNETTNSMEFTINDRAIKGKDLFLHFYNNFREHFKQHRDLNLKAEEIINRAYHEFYKSQEHRISPYFRSLFYIIKFVDNSDVKDKQFYINMICVQLSIQELLLIFYNSSSGIGKETFKPLIEKYALLKSLPRDLLLVHEHESLYNEGAYGNI